MATKLHNITFSSIIFAVRRVSSEGRESNWTPPMDNTNANHHKRNAHVDGVIYKCSNV